MVLTSTDLERTKARQSAAAQAVLQSDQAEVMVQMDGGTTEIKRGYLATITDGGHATVEAATEPARQ